RVKPREKSSGWPAVPRNAGHSSFSAFADRPRLIMPQIDFFQLTDIGRVREINEDAVGHWPHDDGLVFAVAAGLGGAAAGERACPRSACPRARQGSGDLDGR